MRKRNSPAKNTTRKNAKTEKPETKAELVDRTMEKAVLEVWTNTGVHSLANKRAKPVDNEILEIAPEVLHDSVETGTYILREMPTSVQVLTRGTVCRKICQDIFLKAALMQGHRAVYVPTWETYPLWIEEAVIEAANPKVPLKLSVLRKRCRARHREALEVQKQILHQLGIFADWGAAQKTVEPRQEARLVTLISRLRESGHLHDLPRLSPWCPKCTTPIDEADLVQASTSVLNGYVKFPFSSGLEEFGVRVSFCVHMQQLWEIAGVVALGITESAPYRFTKCGEEYLLFAASQLEHFRKHVTKGQLNPKPVKEIEADELKKYTVIHPLFPSKELKIELVPKVMVAETGEEATSVLRSGVMLLNPAHHQQSYNIARSLDINMMSPIFDEAGRFTEEAGQLCGLYLWDAERFIVPQLEKYGYLPKTDNEEIKKPHCPRCKELVVFRPCSKWAFSIPKEEPNPAEFLNVEEYWDNYSDTQHKRIKEIREVALNFRELQVSSQRQWGMPLPILLCDHCDEPLTDKNTLATIRSSIQRSFEFWFGLSVEELLPPDTHCSNCNSEDFRKEATLIEGRFIDLLRMIDNSDLKKPPGGHTTVMFVPQANVDDSEWAKWLAEISVISAVLSRNRPIKTSHPFKQLKLKTLPKIDNDIQIERTFLDKYPADVIRLVIITPDSDAKAVNPEQLEKYAENYLQQYQQLQALLEDIARYLYPFLLDCQLANELEQEYLSSEVYEAGEPFNPTAEEEEDPHQFSRSIRSHQYSNPIAEEEEEIALVKVSMQSDGIKGVERMVTDEMLPIDEAVLAVTTQLFHAVQQAYQAGNFHEIWGVLVDFCRDYLLFYVRSMELRAATTLPAAQQTLSQIATALLQRLAPLTPFLAEHFYPLISIEGATGNRSIFQRNWQLLLPPRGTQRSQSPDIKANDAKTEWEKLKSVYNPDL